MCQRQFKVEDLLQNEFFIDWVLNPNSESDHFWKNWISRYSDKRADIELAIELVKSMHYENHHTLGEDEYSSMMENIFQHKESGGITLYFNTLLKNSFKVAASVIFLIGLVFYFFHDSNSHGSKNNPSAFWSVTATDYGQKKTILLSDGTKIILNSGSKIIYPENFESDERSVRFEGEAFFEVSHDPDRPFIIESPDFTTKVLGTSFNLKSFDEESEGSVSVVSGKVEMKTPSGQVILLNPSQMGIYDKKASSLEQKTFDENKLLAWTRGTLIFQNEDLPAIFRKLEKWYGVKFVITEGVNLKGKYSGEYIRKSLELVLDGLSFTSRFKYNIDYKTITIYEEKTK